VQVVGTPAHVVVNRRSTGIFARHINAGENLCGLADPGQALVQDLAPRCSDDLY